MVGYGCTAYSYFNAALVWPLYTWQGVQSLVRKATFIMTPTSVGLTLGITTFGDMREFVRLMRDPTAESSKWMAQT